MTVTLSHPVHEVLWSMKNSFSQIYCIICRFQQMNHSLLKYVHGVKKQFSKKKMLYIYVRMGIYFLPIRTGRLYSIYYFAKILEIGWNMALFVFLGSDHLWEIVVLDRASSSSMLARACSENWCSNSLDFWKIDARSNT